MKKTSIALLLALLVGCGQQTADEHIAQAQTYLAAGDADAALIELKNAVKIDPKSAEARFQLGQLYIQQQQFESAEKELNRAIEYGYDASKTIPLLSQAYKRTGADVALSEIEHDRSGMNGAEQMEVGYLKLVSLMRLEQEEKALLLIDELNQIETSSFYKPLVDVYSSVIKKDFETAQKKVKAVRSLVPLEAEPMKVQAQIFLQQNDLPGAIEVFQEYVELHPEDNERKFLLANMLVETGRLEEAKPLVDELLKINDKNPLLNKLAAVISASTKGYENAQKYAENALQTNGTDPVLRLLAGYAAYERKDYEASHRHLSMIASDLPDNHPALRLLAASQLELGLNNEVGAVMDRIVAPNEKDAKLFSKAGYELMRAGLVKQASELIEKSKGISTQPEDLARLGVLQLSINKVEGLVNLESAIEKSPDLTSAQSTLAVAYLSSNQLDKAEELAKKWITSSPDDPKPHMLMGNVYFRQKKQDQAEAAFKKAIEVDADFVAAQLELVSFQFKIGKDKEAKEGLAKILAKSPHYTPALGMSYAVKKREGKGSEAIKAVQQALAKDPKNQSLKLLLTRIYLVEKQYKSGLNTLKGFAEDKQTSPEYWELKGQALLKLNQLKDAENHYDSWLAVQPNSKNALLGKLLLLDAQNKIPEGLEISANFLKNRDDIQIQVLNTYFLLLNQQIAEGRKAYNTLPKHVLQLPMAKSLLARLQIADKEYQPALNNALVAYDASPNRRNLLLVLLCYEQLGKKDKAEQLLENHLKMNPSDPTALMVLAERKIGNDNKRAIDSYRKLVKQSNSNFVALNNLAYLLLEAGEVEEAKKHAERAVELQPSNSAALDTLAQVLVAQNDVKQALKYYERIDATGTTTEEIKLNHIDALLADGQQKLAIRKIAKSDFKQPASQKKLADIKQKYGL